jgi:hypothetical protein
VLLAHVDWNAEQQQQSIHDRIGAIEVVAFLFSIFTVYGCGPTPGPHAACCQHDQSPSVDTRTALIVCIRFSA